MRIARFASLLVALLVLAACATTRPGTVEVLRSDLDTREYRYLELPNKMQVLLVSDSAADKSAASLRVRTGSSDDPADRQGLAHFLEHMLFLGTAKYPDADEYQAFVNAHGGSHNAYTAVDHTLYFFEIEPAALAEALDRFAQFFVAPLFNPEYVQREANAVDSEYRMGLKDDSRREYDVLRELVQPGHPLASLAVGNLETLGPARGDLRGELLAFHERHYSANLMSLVVLGREPLDTLEGMARERFGAIANRAARARETAPSMFAPGALPLEVRIRPIKQLRELTMAFPVPSARERYAAKPLEYIGNLIGHEGPGSVLFDLRQRGWAEALGAGAGLDQFGQDLFQVSIQLTEAGLGHEREIVARVFHAIAAIRERGVEAWRYEEQAELSTLGFRFREKGDASAAVIQLANALRDYPPAEVQRGPWLFADYDAALVRDYLDRLRPDNLLLTVTNDQVSTERESRWFATPHAVKRLDPASLAPLQSDAAFALPLPNEFIPARVATKPADTAPARPQRLVDEPAYRLWHLQDAQFASPKASLYFQLYAPHAGASARDRALGALFARLVQDRLNPMAYPATLAGLQYGIAPSARGLTVKLSGWDDRQEQLLTRILEALAATRFPEDRFASLKAELLREWGNSARDRPMAQLVDAMETTLIRGTWPDAELAAALVDAGPDDLADYLAGLRTGATLDVLAHGNFLADEARALGQRINQAVGGTGEPAPPAIEVRELAADRAVLTWPVDHPDSAALLYLQGRDVSREERAHVALAGQVLSSPFFDELRTERQLGYAVFLQPMPLARVPGLVLVVQSPVAGPERLMHEYEAFLQRHAAALEAIPPAEFERHRAALAARLREAPGSLAEKTERLWGDLGLGEFAFDDREQVALVVEDIERLEWIRFVRETLAGEGRRALMIQTRGTAHAAEPLTAERVLEDAAKYYRFDWSAPVQVPARALH